MSTPSDALLHTPLHALHVELGAKLVPFAGYEMPVAFPSGILAEHRRCRESAALFDVSHMRVVVVKCDDEGNIDAADLRSKCEEHRHRLAAAMITYPSTYGLFDPHIKELCATVHRYGGRVYVDGANMTLPPLGLSHSSADGGMAYSQRKYS